MAEPRKRGPKPKDRAAATPHPGIPDPPAGLGPEASKHWAILTSLLAEAKIVSELDGDALRLYIDLWERRRVAEKELRRKPRKGERAEDFGPVITAVNGYRQLNPWYTISVQCLKDMRVFLGMFGLSPVARAKLTLPEPDGVDEKWREPE